MERQMEERKFRMGEIVRFKTSGYEIADVRNPNPASTSIGKVSGKVQLGYVPLWCERESREPTTIYVALGNILPLGEPVN